MPTSKDIIRDAEKAIKDNTTPKKAIDDMIKQGVVDTGAYAKARAELGTSIRSMGTSVKLLEDRLKELNAEFTALKKNEPVMRAPADAKQYQALVKSFTEAIRDGMKYHKDLSATLKKAEEIAKQR